MYCAHAIRAERGFKMVKLKRKNLVNLLTTTKGETHEYHQQI